MPMKLTDRRLATFYKTLEQAKGTIADNEARKILAEIGDSTSLSPAQVLAKLESNDLSDADKTALVKKGMSASEKKDLQAIVDNGTVKMTPNARTMFKDVLEQLPPPPPVTGALTLSGSQANGLSGTAKPGDKIEAINLSASPTGRLHLDDTVVVATAGADGKFSGGKLTGDQGIKEGDYVRLRARHTDGTTSDWVTVRASGVATKDTRDAEVALFRIGLTAKGDGTVGLSNVNDGRQISEPGAKLQFTNTRTNETTTLTLDADGTFAKDAALKGKAGDTFNVAATDGVNNLGFGTSLGKLVVPGTSTGGGGGDVDLPDPALHKDELDASGKPKFGKERFSGPLFIDGVKPTDVAQGQLGDCYVPSGFAALAVQNPDAIKNMFKDNGDGTYTVTFKERSGSGWRDVPIKVDGDLYVRAWGGPLYGSANSDDRAPKTMEMWFPLAEKAYAQWKGSYNAIGNGGMSDDIFAAVLGRDGQEMTISEGNADAVWTQLKKSFDAKQPISAGTYGDEEIPRYANTGIYTDHSYSVMGYKEKNGERYVTLRNPWGESEPAGNGANDGIFDIKLADFSKLFETLMYTNPR
jgi:hypothetical protein